MSRSAELINVNEFAFCKKHGWEHCFSCGYDLRMVNNVQIENDERFVDYEEALSPDRTPLNVYAIGILSTNKKDERWETVIIHECSQHRKPDCKDCFDWAAIILAEAEEY